MYNEALARTLATQRSQLCVGLRECEPQSRSELAKGVGEEAGKR